MGTFTDYATKYQHVRMERRNGILQLTFHTGGDTLRWGGGPHEELGFAFRDIGSDPENRVIILTGTGDAFIEEVREAHSPASAPPEESRAVAQHRAR